MESNICIDGMVMAPGGTQLTLSPNEEPGCLSVDVLRLLGSGINRLIEVAFNPASPDGLMASNPGWLALLTSPEYGRFERGGDRTIGGIRNAETGK